MTPEEFVARWAPSGGAELANSQAFILELCDLMGVPRPEPTQADERLNDYTYERAVRHTARGLTTTNRIDCYKRGCFILESKQGAEAHAKRADPRQGELLGEAAAPLRAGTAARGTPAWDRAMRRAFEQARGYVADLPPDHAPPPFLIVMDVGHVIELYADFAGQGRNYAQFPDRGTFQLPLDRLRDPDALALLRAVWTAPASLNPALRTAEVTRDVAERLALVAARLEARHDPEAVAGFLMRCLFTMFAEDAGLLPEDGFKYLLADLKTRPDDFKPALEALWATMDAGGYDPALRATVRRFNGGLFHDRTALPLDAGGIHELHVAASKDWREVEPAIFGTFLERALNPRERAKLGAHYTPRAYVERLVTATVMDPLREDWGDAQARMAELVDHGDEAGALREARAFHHALCQVRVLDPACGTGNFLYVALELLKRLEDEVLERIKLLVPQRAWTLPAETVNPSQFRGLETNPRAAAIAEVVLWVGYLQWQLRSSGLAGVGNPVLKAHGTIECRDAVLEWAAEQPRLDAGGAPVTEWDRRTFKLHPITGEEVPDADARVPAVTYLNPRRAPWPAADFIVGNPPFIGGKDMRAELGDGYAEAVWAARREVPGGADFVMQWWDEAARRLAAGQVRRFGFITTNSITQAFSRRVVERHLRDDKRPVSLAFAVPDHSWVKGGGRAAVRIAMTVMRRGRREGVLGTVVEERDLDTDAPLVRLDERRGTVTAKLTLGADVTAATPLLSNEGLASRGMSLHGAGFIVQPMQARMLGLGTVPGLDSHILPYINGRDLVQTSRGAMVIDLHGLTAEQARDRFPAVYGHLLDRVKPERDAGRGRTADATAYADAWWLFGKARPELRAFTADLPRFIVTVETARHRLFRFLDAGTRPDNMLVAFGLDNAAALALLSSRVHVLWAIAAGGWLGVGNDPRYSKTKTFDPFPFPALLTDLAPDPHGAALLDRLRSLGESLEARRTDALAATGLTLTGLYNRLERRREALGGGAPFADGEEADHARANVPALAAIHDDLDRASLGAWGWDDLAPALVGRPGATLPSDLKGRGQEAAEDELLSRLVALNAERRAEEARGQVRWLRPAYQAPRLGARAPAQSEMDVTAPGGVPGPAGRPWPEEPRAQFAAVRELLDESGGALDAGAVARAFAGRLTDKRRRRVAEVLDVLADLGHLRRGEGASPPLPHAAKAAALYGARGGRASA